MSTPERSGFACLIRVSTQQQLEAYGHDWQLENLPPYGEQWLGPASGGIWDEGASSTSLPLAERPVMQEMLAELELTRPGYLLVADQDRLSRTDDFGLIKMILRRLGIKLAFYRDNAEPEILDLDDEYGDFSSDIFAAVAKLEKRRIVKRMHRGKRHAAASGNAVMPVPYGYYKPAKGEVAIVEEKAEIVRLIFARIVGGSSIRKTVQWLNGSDIASPRGRVGGWTISYLSRIVRNPAYVGRAEMMGEIVAFPAIVEEEIFQAIPAALERNKTFSKRNNTRFDYLAKSLARCDRCGRSIAGTPRHGKPGYRCNGQLHDASKGLAKRCDQPVIFAAPVDEAIWAEVSKLVLNPELIAAHAHRQPTVIAAEATFLRRKLAEVEARRRNLLRQHELSVISDTELTERLAEIEEVAGQERERLAELEVAVGTEEVDLTRLDEAEKLCRALAPRLPELAFAEKRQLVEKLVRRIGFDGRKITVEVIVPTGEEVARSVAA